MGRIAHVAQVTGLHPRPTNQSRGLRCLELYGGAETFRVPRSPSRELALARLDVLRENIHIPPILLYWLALLVPEQFPLVDDIVVEHSWDAEKICSCTICVQAHPPVLQMLQSKRFPIG